MQTLLSNSAASHGSSGVGAATSRWPSGSLQRRLAEIVLLAAAYVGAEWLSRLVFPLPSCLRPVGLPAGVILGTVLICGPRVWPGILLGAVCSAVCWDWGGGSAYGLATAVGLGLASGAGGGPDGTAGRRVDSPERRAGADPATGGECAAVCGLRGASGRSWPAAWSRPSASAVSVSRPGGDWRRACWPVGQATRWAC